MIFMNRYQLAMMTIPQMFALYVGFIVVEWRFVMDWDELVYRWLPMYVYMFVVRYIVMTVHINRKKKKTV